MSEQNFKFTDEVTYIKGIGTRRAELLAKINIFTKYDLLTHYPRSYENHDNIAKICDLIAGQTVLVVGEILNITSREIRNLTIINAYLDDGTGYLKLTWFNQKYLLNKLKEKMRLFIIGKVRRDVRSDFLVMDQIQNFTFLGEEEEPELGIIPIYVSTSSLTQKVFRTAMKNLLNQITEFKEILPQKILSEQNLISLDRAMRAIHFPKDFLELDEARKRLAFDELFLIQCGLRFIKRRNKRERLGVSHAKNGELIHSVLKILPFKMTGDQKKVFNEITNDMESSLPMRRLIQGDVGSGKTLIALLALVKTVENGFQGAFMAPTEILAMQHYERFSRLLDSLNIRIGLLSAKVTRSKKLKREIYRKISAHEFDIIIGTHALLQEGVNFSNLGLVVTDEQHRFGVSQRASLEKKSCVTPDMLVMTATPIPRTMILTIYGDLDVSLIKELPPGRKTVKTFLRNFSSRVKIYEFVHSEILKGYQAYVVCPLIEKSESEGFTNIDSIQETFEFLSQGIFKNISCALLHGKMKSTDKDEIMEKFRTGTIKLLVSTTVIEVGVDVPNANVMVIEHAERFGLSQLHQLRGRVGRGSEKSYCILISDNESGTAKERLKILETTSDGFKLAEQDLKLRGPGEFFGESQHGLPDLKIANVFQDVELLIRAREAAEKFIEDEQNLKYFLSLKNHLALAYGNKFNQIIES